MATAAESTTTSSRTCATADSSRAVLEGRTGNVEVAKLSMSDLEDRLTRLGKGTAGVIHSFHDVKNDRDVAVKQQGAKKTEYELQFLRTVNHRNIAKLLGVTPKCEGRFDRCLVLEAGECDLLDVAMEDVPFSLDETGTLRMLRQILLAVSYLHESNIAHLDIKPANVVIFHGRKCFKLIDFGCAVMLHPHNGHSQRHFDSTRGTVCYTSPEMNLGPYPVLPPTDVWSVGSLIVVLAINDRIVQPTPHNLLKRYLLKVVGVTGPINPSTFPGCQSLNKYSQYMRHVTEASRLGEDFLALLDTTIGTETALFDLLRNLWTVDPMKRISARDALQHLVFQRAGLAHECDHCT